ncbi:MAG: carboxypeptidase-like regulatory domain-containing protein [Bacteroidetes bacterium]|nr:carboxypeptidase-like regulatory domain-containing protein [Bacteroidota bacterium]MCY4233555.1 carboxypeptidase-like regulatory domain-containing protein [Bacteroidota bacterium]
MNFKQLLSFLGLFIVIVPVALAQQGKIDGVISDATTGETVPGASVVIEGTTQGTATQVDGYFFINNVRPGTYTLIVSFVGYVTQRVEGVRVSTGLTTTKDIQLAEDAVGMEEIVVTSERPIVQLDVSANVASLNSEAFEDLPVASIVEVLDLQAGIEPGLSIRGGGSDQIAFVVDGMNLRTGRNNGPFSNISYTAIEEVQVQTGGFNAEYGNVRSGVVNVTTKDPSRTRYTVDALYRHVPPQPKAFEALGGTSLDDCAGLYQQEKQNNIAVVGDCDSWFIRPFLDPDVAMNGTSPNEEIGHQGWDPYTRNQYAFFEGGWNALAENLRTGDNKFDVTPQDMQDYFKHTHRKDNKVDKPDYEVDVTVAGPLVSGLSSKLGDLRFSASYRGNQTAYIIPQSRDIYTNQTFQAKIVSDIARGIKVSLRAMRGVERGMNANQEIPNLQMYGGNIPAYPWWGSGAKILDADERYGGVLYSDGAFALADIDHTMIGGSLTHTLNQNTFYEVTLQNISSKYRTHLPNLRDGSSINGSQFTSVAYTKDGVITTDGKQNRDQLTCFGGSSDLNGDGETIPYCVGDEPFGFLGQSGNLRASNVTIGGHWVKSRDTSDVSVFTGRFDLTSQINRVLQIKTGAELIVSDFQLNYKRVNLAQVGPEPQEDYPYDRQPIQGAAYAQGKLEFQGMIANLGVRLDFFDVNTDWWVSDNPFDQAYRRRVDDLDALLEKESPPIQMFVSPRLGVSFPITQQSKIYFNYGHFRQMLDPFNIFGVRQSRSGGIDILGNPEHPMPKTVAYELGFDQNLFDQYLLRISGFYRDISNQSRDVTYNGLGGVVNYRLKQPWNYADVRGAEITLNKLRGKWIRGFINYTYLQRKWGSFGYSEFNENTFQQQNYLLGSTDFRQSTPIAEPFVRGNLLVLTPRDFGSSVLNGALLGDWRISLLGEWRKGQQWRWAGGGGVPSELQENVNWRSYVNFDLRFTKHINTRIGGAQVFLDVSNLFNRRHLYRVTGFRADDGFDFNRYMWSLHLPEDIFDQTNRVDETLSYPEKASSGSLPYIWIPGNDQPGVFRHPDIAYQPMRAFASIDDVAQPDEFAWYWAADTQTYSRWRDGSWQEVPADEVEQALSDKAYIDMPNMRFNTFLNNRRITLGIRITL